MTATENWFAFRAFNSQTLYGFGTTEEADRYEDALNAKREINVYAAHQLTEAEATELKLESNNEAFAIEDELRAAE